jgi:hypothetical protein
MKPAQTPESRTQIPGEPAAQCCAPSPQRRPVARLSTLAFALLGMAASTAALAQALTPPAGGPYVLRKQIIATGGERASGGPYVLTGTLGQVATDPNPASGAGYRLAGGFHSASLPLTDALFADGFEN